MKRFIEYDHATLLSRTHVAHRLLAIFVGGLLLGGCVMANSTRLSSATYPPVPPELVTIYLSEADVPSDYIKIGLINAQGNHGWTNEEQMLNRMRAEAGKMGANGIILSQIEEPGAGAKIAGAVLGVGVNRRGQVVAVLVGENVAETTERRQQRISDARAAIPEQLRCATSSVTQGAAVYRVTAEKAPVLNTTGGNSRTLAVLNEGDHVLRLDAFGQFEKVCFGGNNGHGWIAKDQVAAVDFTEN